MHAKTVLFVHNHQCQATERNIFLEQGMGTYHHGGFATANGLQSFLSCLALNLSRQPRQLDAKRLQPAAEILVVLFRQYFRGRHQRHLGASTNGLQCCQRRHHGFTRPHVSLHQPQHGYRLAEILADLGHNLSLCPGKAERKQIKKTFRQITGWQ